MMTYIKIIISAVTYTTYVLLMIYLWTFGITQITYDLLMIYLWIS